MIFKVFKSFDFEIINSTLHIADDNFYLFLIGLFIIIAALAKSAQIGLHGWLPDAMEGQGKLIALTKPMNILLIIYLSYFILGHLQGDLSTPLYIINEPIDYPKGNTKELWTALGGLTVQALPIYYVKPYDSVIVGDLLADGHLNLSKNGLKARLQFTQSCKTLGGYEFISHLRHNVYNDLCNTTSNLTPWPSEKPSQYTFGTKFYDWLGQIHKDWYKLNTSDSKPKFIKVLPENITEYLSDKALAHWIMGDGYWDKYRDKGTVILCTDNFTKDEVEILIKALNDKFGIKSNIKKRNNDSPTSSSENARIYYRIRISSKDSNISLLRNIVSPLILSSSKYKIGL